MYDKLFSPVTIRGMELKNRIILPAMGTKFAGKDCMVTNQLIDYHTAIAKGGTALSIVEVSSVHTLSAPRGFLSISEDKYIPGLKKLADAIHEAGAKAGIQLWQGSLAVGGDKAAMILVASDMPVSPQITLPGITKEQIAEITDCYGKAAKRACEAGFDCVEIHMAHNYLPHSFLSGGINHRTDEYGGSFENRARFPLEVITAVRANMPDSMPLFIRIGAHDDYLEGGLTIEEVIRFCKLAGEAGVDVLDVSRGNIISAGLKYEVPPVDLPKAFNIENAARIRRETGMLTIGVGRINEPGLAEQVLAEDKVDMVVMGRAQLADNNFVQKSKEGNIKDINFCVGCNQGCYDGFENPDTPHITCLRNPALGREAECALIPTDNPQTVLVAGGGIAGLTAAITLKQRGHNPILCEAADKLGGQFEIAGMAPRKSEMKDGIQSMSAKAQRIGVDIRMNTKVTPALVAEIKPYALFCAIGGEPIIPPIPGVDLPSAVSSHDVLTGKTVLSGNVTVIGGGLVGMETAEYLAERGCRVTVLEMLPEVCADMGRLRKICVMESIYAAGITPVTDIKVTAIEDGRVIGEKGSETAEFPCDWAVLAVGARANDTSALEAVCYDQGIAYFSMGDALRARRAINATREAFDLARTFDQPEVYHDALKPNKTVFVTGGTGTMGQETVKQLLSRSSRFRVRILARPSEKNQELLKRLTHPSLEVVWGDMSDYDDILRCVTGTDYVLHIGAMVSPAADRYPKETLYTNIGSTLNIIKAIKAQPDPDKVHLCYIGTVAMTGSRMDPVHHGRIGDPMSPSIFDYYAISKVFSEMAVYESGLKYWVSIRQTGQHPSAEGAADEPIIFHQPPNNVLEWSTSIESGICMANLCEEWVPESFWRRAYNLSSGKKWRTATWEFSELHTKNLGTTYKDANDPREQALFNFHGQYYTDSDLLNDILHFRCIDFDQYWEGVRAEIDAMMANPMIRAMMPTPEVQQQQKIAIGRKPTGFHWMFENDKEDWIRAFFGSREKQKAIKSFDEGYELYHPSEEPTLLDHGYDETKGLENLTKADLDKAAVFRGGECLSDPDGDIHVPVKWKCACGHEFRLSLNAVLGGGHWCPECMRYEWAYGDMAKVNPFYAQVWNPQHDEDETYCIKMDYSAFDIFMELKDKLGV